MAFLWQALSKLLNNFPEEKLSALWRCTAGQPSADDQQVRLVQHGMISTNVDDISDLLQ